MVSLRHCCTVVMMFDFLCTLKGDGSTIQLEYHYTCTVSMVVLEEHSRLLSTAFPRHREPFTRVHGREDKSNTLYLILTVDWGLTLERSNRLMSQWRMHQGVPLCPALSRAKHAASDSPVFQTPETLLFPQPRFPLFHPYEFSHCAFLERGRAACGMHVSTLVPASPHNAT